MAQFNSNQRIILVTGKGGVGKSTVAAAVAQGEARKGLKTLLVELGDISYYQYLYGQDIQYSPKAIDKNLDICIWSGESCLKEYVHYLLKIKAIADLFFDNKVMKTFIRAAPALKELAILGKITSGIRNWGPPLPYDVIVVDGMSTGHFMALLQAPFGMGQLVESGPMGEQSRNIIAVLKNNQFTQFKIVTLPEELPTTETIELYKGLDELMGAKAEVICNKFYECSLTIPFLEGELMQMGDADQVSVDFTENILGLLRRQVEYAQILDQAFPKYKKLPLVFSCDESRVVNAVEARLNG